MWRLFARGGIIDSAVATAHNGADRMSIAVIGGHSALDAPNGRTDTAISLRPGDLEVALIDIAENRREFVGRLMLCCCLVQGLQTAESILRTIQIRLLHLYTICIVSSVCNMEHAPDVPRLENSPDPYHNNTTDLTIRMRCRAAKRSSMTRFDGSLDAFCTFTAVRRAMSLSQPSNAHMAGSDTWIIYGSLLEKMKRASNGQVFTESFEIAGLTWQIRAFPNGRNNSGAGSFDVYVRLESLPSAWQHIMARVRIVCNETESGFTIYEQYRQGTSKGWHSNSEDDEDTDIDMESRPKGRKKKGEMRHPDENMMSVYSNTRGYVTDDTSKGGYLVQGVHSVLSNDEYVAHCDLMQLTERIKCQTNTISKCFNCPQSDATTFRCVYYFPHESH